MGKKMFIKNKFDKKISSFVYNILLKISIMIKGRHFFRDSDFN